MSTSSFSTGSINETDFQKKLLELARLTENLLNKMENGEFRCRRQLEEINRIRGGDSQKFHSWDSTLKTMEQRKKAEKTTRCCLSKQQEPSTSPRYERCNGLPGAQVTAKRSHAGGNHDFESSLHCPPKFNVPESEHVGCCGKKKKRGKLPAVPPTRHYPSNSSSKASFCSDKECCICKKNAQGSHVFTLVSLTQSEEISREVVEICPDKITAAQEKVIVVHSFEAVNAGREKNTGAQKLSRHSEKEIEKQRCPPYGDCRNKSPETSDQLRKSLEQGQEKRWKENLIPKSVKPVESLASDKSRILQMDRLKKKSLQHPNADEVTVYIPPPVSKGETKSKQKLEYIAHPRKQFEEFPKECEDNRNWEKPDRPFRQKQKHDDYIEEMMHWCHCPSKLDFDNYDCKMQPVSTREYFQEDEKTYSRSHQKEPKLYESGRPINKCKSSASISCRSDELDLYRWERCKRSTLRKDRYPESTCDKYFRGIQNGHTRDYTKPSQEMRKKEIKSSQDCKENESSEELQNFQKVRQARNQIIPAACSCLSSTNRIKRYCDNDRLGRKSTREKSPDSYRTPKSVPKREPTKKPYRPRGSQLRYSYDAEKPSLGKCRKNFQPPLESEETDWSEESQKPQITPTFYRGEKLGPNEERRCCNCGAKKPLQEVEQRYYSCGGKPAPKDVHRKETPPSQKVSRSQAKNRQSSKAKCGFNLEGAPIYCKCGLLKPSQGIEPLQKGKLIEKSKKHHSLEFPEDNLSDDGNYLINENKAECLCCNRQLGQQLKREHQASSNSSKTHDQAIAKGVYRASSCPSDLSVLLKKPAKELKESKCVASSQYREIGCTYLRRDIRASYSDSKINRGSKQERQQSAQKKAAEYTISSKNRRLKDKLHSGHGTLTCECKNGDNAEERVNKVVEPEIEKQEATSDNEACYCGKTFCRMEPGRNQKVRKSSSCSPGSKPVGSQQIVGCLAFSGSKTIVGPQGIVISQAIAGSQAPTNTVQVSGGQSVITYEERRYTSFGKTRLPGPNLVTDKPLVLPAIEPSGVSDRQSGFSRADGSQIIDETERSQIISAEFNSAYSSCISQPSVSCQTIQGQSTHPSTKPQEPSLRTSGVYSVRHSGKGQDPRLSKKSLESPYLSRLSEKSEDISQGSSIPAIAPPPIKDINSEKLTTRAPRLCCKCGRETCPNMPEKICGKGSLDEGVKKCRCERRMAARKSAGKTGIKISSEKTPDLQPEHRRISTGSPWLDPNESQKLLAPIPPRRSTSESASTISLIKDSAE